MSDKKHLTKSMVEFVKDCRKNNKLDNIRRFWYCEKYANALSQTPCLGHFIPCDENDEPLNYEEIKQSVIDGTETWAIWENACYRVLFDGITKKNGLFFLPNKQILHQSKLGNITFEQILIYNLPLTKAGAKFFGL